MNRKSIAHFLFIFAFVIIAFSCKHEEEIIPQEVEPPTIDTSDKTPTAIPSDFTAEAMDSAVKLSWIDAADDDIFGYELSWTPKSSVSVSRAVTAMDADSIFVSASENERNEITVSNLLNDTEYTFTLKSMDTSGNKSEGVIA